MTTSKDTLWGRLLVALSWPVVEQESGALSQYHSQPKAFLDKALTALSYPLLEKHRSPVNVKHYRGEKVLLDAIVRDKRNWSAHMKLGILYVRHDDTQRAINAFQCAADISGTAAAFHNLGLAYYCTEDYEKASIALGQALSKEDRLAMRHVAYAKVQEKLGNDKVMFDSLERAVMIEKNVTLLVLLHEAYREHGMESEAAIVQSELIEMITPFTRVRKLVQSQKHMSEYINC